MSRLLSAARNDAVLQFRGGFYYVGAAVALFYVAILRQLPAEWPINLPLLIPAALVINAMITTFYFVAALVLLEKAEGTLGAIAVSPLRAGEYLGAKVASLTFLAVAENAAVVVLYYGYDFDVWRLLVGLCGLSAFYTLAGFVAISHYDSINAYLLPSSLLVVAMLLPLLGYFGAFDTILWYLHPVQPFLSLIRSAFVAEGGLELAYGLGGAALWLAVAYRGARRAFGPLVIR